MGFRSKNFCEAVFLHICNMWMKQKEAALIAVDFFRF